MELLDILQAFKEGKITQYRGHSDQIWQSVCCGHKWNTEKFEYRIKPDREIYPYTREELFEAISLYGSKVMVKSTGDLFYISDVLSDKIQLKKGRKGSEICVSYQDFADEYCWNDSMWPMSCTLCGWDSQIYDIVEEPIYDKGVRWGTERIVKRREV